MARFAVAGAGIAGLSAALALGRAGHAVELFERRTTGGETGAGLQLSPNATRLLASWGLLPALEAMATEPDDLCIRRGRDAAVLARVPLGPDARRRYRAPTLVLHRADLHGVLSAAVASTPGIGSTWGAEVRGIDAADGLVQLSGAASDRSFDGLIRADGVHAPAPDGTRPIVSGRTAWRTLVPADRLPALFRQARTNLWLGRRAHIVHYPLRGGTVVNAVVIVADAPGDTPGSTDFWARPGDPERLRAHLAGWHETALHLLDAAASWQVWPLLHRREPVRWPRGRQTAVGDAAHPMLPFLAQGASQAIEDAAALSDAVASQPADIPQAFRAYERGRAPRVRTVQARSERQGRVYLLGGSAAVARDVTLKLLGPRRLLAGMDWLYGPSEGRQLPE